MVSGQVLVFVRNHGQEPRYRSNRLVCVRDCARTALAWNSIVEDVKSGRLSIDDLQDQQAKELQSAEDLLPRVAHECYRWQLCPVQATSTDRKPTIEAFPLNTSGSALGVEIQRMWS
jgi:hypothetical protein